MFQDMRVVLWGITKEMFNIHMLRMLQLTTIGTQLMDVWVELLGIMQKRGQYLGVIAQVCLIGIVQVITEIFYPH